MSTRCVYLPYPLGLQKTSVALSMWLQREPSSLLISVVSMLTVKWGKERYRRKPLAILESRESHMNHHYLCPSPCLGNYRADRYTGRSRRASWNSGRQHPLLAAGALERCVLQSLRGLGHIFRFNVFPLKYRRSFCTKAGTPSPKQGYSPPCCQSLRAG